MENNPLERLKQEHLEIERELVELETIMEFETVNYSNLKNVFEKLCEIWDYHEEKEERLFPVLELDQIKIPVKEMTFSHKDLRPHKEAIKKAIASGSEFEMKKSLKNNGRIMIEKLRKHIEDEENVLYSIVLTKYTNDELKKIWYEITFLDKI